MIDSVILFHDLSTGLNPHFPPLTGKQQNHLVRVVLGYLSFCFPFLRESVAILSVVIKLVNCFCFVKPKYTL